MKCTVLMCCIILMLSLNSAFATLPLNTDDPSTVPQRVLELQQAYTGTYSDNSRLIGSIVTTGLAKNMDFGVGFGYQWVSGSTVGFTDTVASLKWRFIGDGYTENSFALVTGYGFRQQIRDIDLGDYYQTTLLAMFPQKNQTYLINLGRTWVKDKFEPDKYFVGLAVEKPVNQRFTFLSEYSNYIDTHDSPGRLSQAEFFPGFRYNADDGYVYTAGFGYRPFISSQHWRVLIGFVKDY